MNNERRNFIKLSALGGAVIAFGFSACENKKYVPKQVNATDRINVGLVGCGQRGVDQVLEGLKHLNEYKIVAFCDVIPEHMDRASDQLPYQVKQFLDYREMVIQNEVDLVIVATPLKWHFPVCKAALLANKHVVCEKMMTYTIEEAVELERLVKQSGNLFKVSYEARNNPAYQIARDLVSEGAIGDVIHVDCTWNRRSSWRKDIRNPNKIINFPTGEQISRERLLNWRMSTEFSGDLMGEIVSHNLDAAQWILSSGPLKSACGVGKISFWKDGRNTFDNIHAVLDYGNDLAISCNSILSNVKEGYKVSIYGRNATIQLSLGGGVIIPELKQDKKLREQVDALSGASYKLIGKIEERKLTLKDPARDYYSQWVKGYLLDTLMGYKEFAQCIVENKPSPIPVVDGKHSSIAVHLANRAMREGGVHEWQKVYDV